MNKICKLIKWREMYVYLRVYIIITIYRCVNHKCSSQHRISILLLIFSSFLCIRQVSQKQSFVQKYVLLHTSARVFDHWCISIVHITLLLQSSIEIFSKQKLTITFNIYVQLKKTSKVYHLKRLIVNNEYY